MPAIIRYSGAVARDPAIEAWFESRSAPLRPLARRWFATMRKSGPDVVELLHDDYATVCVGDAPFAYVGAFTAHVNVGFYHGVELPDPAGLLQGTGKRMRHTKLRPDAAIDEQALAALIAAAYRDIIARLQLPE